MKRLQHLPVPILPTMVGACTLSNVFLTMGYTWVRHITMLAATLILLAYIGKIILYPSTCRKEYSNTVPMSLYAGFSMILMILGSYYMDSNAILGKGLWLLGIVIHAMHILIFAWRNVAHGVKMDTFVPSWFVTANGIMVSVVVGAAMKEPLISKIIMYYGIIIFTVLIPFMIYRLCRYPIKDAFYHTQAIVLAPSSLCVVSYLNVIKDPNPIILYYLYTCVALSLLFIIIKLPSFFSFTFTPAYAGLTFPMAIGCVATSKFAAYVSMQGMTAFGSVLKEIGGIQIYLTTGIIVYVLMQFMIMLKKSIHTA